MLSPWALRQQRSTESASTGLPSQVPAWASSPCLSPRPPASSFCTSDSSLSPTLEDEHVLIFISGFPSPRYFPSNSEHHPLLSNPAFRLCSAQRPPWLLLQPPSPYCTAPMLPSWSPSPRLSSMLAPFLTLSFSSTPSSPKLVLGALSPSLLSPFSPLPWIAAQISFSPLLLIACPCSFSRWSSFSTPCTLCVPSPAGPFFSPAHYFLTQLVQLP